MKMQHQSRLVVHPPVGCSELHMSYGFEPILPRTTIYKNVSIKNTSKLLNVLHVSYSHPCSVLVSALPLYSPSTCPIFSGTVALVPGPHLRVVAEDGGLAHQL